VRRHVTVSGYVEYNCEYCARLGVLILIVFVTFFVTFFVTIIVIDFLTLINEIYTGNANDKMNKTMHNPVDICLTRSLRWSTGAGTAEKKLSSYKRFLQFFYKGQTRLEIFSTERRRKTTQAKTLMRIPHYIMIIQTTTFIAYTKPSK